MFKSSYRPRIVIAALAVSLLLLAGAGIRSEAAIHAEPSHQGVSQDPVADAEWAMISRLIAQVQAEDGAEGFGFATGNNMLFGELSKRLLDEYLHWFDGEKLLLRDVGLQFYDQYPTDPRRWTWLVATLQYEPQYLRIDNSSSIAIDTLAEKVWEHRRPSLVLALYASSQATEQQKAIIAFKQLSGTADYSPQTLDLLAHSYRMLADKYPHAQNAFLNAVLLNMIGSAHRDSAQERRVMAELKKSSNSYVQTLLTAQQTEEEARHTPFDIHFTALDGRHVSLAALRGKVVLVEFSAYTWCGACRMVEPSLKAIYDEYQPKGLEVIGFALENAPSDSAYVKKYVADHGIRWPLYFEGNGMAQNFYVQHFELLGVPGFFLFDQKGLLVGQSKGSDGAREIEPQIRQLLGLKPASAQQ